MSKAASTRDLIIRKSFDLIYQRGYQSTSIDDIISTTNVTKGAFFYHFKNKEQMGLGLISELLYPNFYTRMVSPLKESTDPAKDVYSMMESLLNDTIFFNVTHGCPAINLIEEMAPVNESFRKALAKLTLAWHNAIASSIRSAQEAGTIGTRESPEQVAVMVISGYSGIRMLGKIMGRSVYKTYLTSLKEYLSSI